MCPKFTSDPYFVAANGGAQEAAKELGVTVEFQGPVNADVAAQGDIIDRWIRRKVTAITVSANDANALAPAMRRAMAQGIKVSTFDADVLPDARQVFLNQATFDGMGRTMVDMMVRDAGGSFLCFVQHFANALDFFQKRADGGRQGRVVDINVRDLMRKAAHIYLRDKQSA